MACKIPVATVQADKGVFPLFGVAPFCILGAHGIRDERKMESTRLSIYMIKEDSTCDFLKKTMRWER